METFRLKNIVILILVLLNLFLLATLVMRESGEYTVSARLEAELQELFASSNVTLTAHLPDEEPPASLSVSRDPDQERAMAARLLGESLTSYDDGGGVSRYETDQGQAVFYPSGNFSITGQLSASGKAEDACGDFCRQYGYEDLTLNLDEDGSGSAQATLYQADLPVTNAAVSFLFLRGELISVSGVFIPAGSAAAAGSDESALSAATALTRFLAARRESGAVVSAVSEVSLCYQLGGYSSSLSLVPAWCITTDTVNYYVNCSDGTVTHD